MILHRNEKELIRVLFKEGTPLSVHELAELSGMSWVTAKKYLKHIEALSIIVSQKRDKRTKYSINRQLVKRLFERKHED